MKNDNRSRREIKQNERLTGILERLVNNMEVSASCRLDIPLNMHNVRYYGAYYSGVLNTLSFVRDNVIPMMKGEDKVYMEALLELATKSKDNARRLLEREYEVHYRNHEKNKKGKVVKCEAFFAKRITRYEEVV